MGNNAHFKNLHSISGAPVSTDFDVESKMALNTFADIGVQLSELLTEKNGFYAFESSLHVIPIGKTDQINLCDWNSENLWRNKYDGMASELFCCAQDAFGNQFCFHKNNICLFEVETGDIRNIASTLYAWAENILKDCNVLTGFPLLHDWQTYNGALKKAID